MAEVNNRASYLPYPPHWINAYLKQELEKYVDIGVSETQALSPIFATTPTNINELWNQVLQSGSVSNPLIIQYEHLMRLRTRPFYQIRKEQLVYYLYSDTTANIYNAINVMTYLFDREDEAAQDLNKWCAQNVATVGQPHNVYFHNMRVFHLDESRDIIELGSAKTFTANKIIIEYDYHVKTGPVTIPGTLDTTVNPYD